MHLQKQRRHPVRGGARDNSNTLMNGVRYISVRVVSCKMWSAGAIPSFNRNGDDDTPHPAHGY
jgi:hypothetical protein